MRKDKKQGQPVKPPVATFTNASKRNIEAIGKSRFYLIAEV